MESLCNIVSANSVILSALILFVTYIFIIIEKISKVTVALIGASLTILLGILSQVKWDGELNPHYFINYIDFNVIFLLVGMMVIVNITAKSGVFRWLAIELLKLTKGKPVLILVTLALFTAFASAFLDNVTTVILVVPVTYAIVSQLELDPIPFFITEIIASNIGGTATLIGDPPNIIIGSKAGFSFMTFVNELTGIVFLILLVSIGFLILFFRKKLQTSDENMAKIAKIDNSASIKDRKLMKRSLIVLALVILGFVTHDITHLEACIIAMTGASFMLAFERPERVLPHVEWNTIFFFVGLFIIIGGLEASGAIKCIATWLLTVTKGNESATAMIVLWASGILSGIIDNIPYTATMVPLIYQIQLVEGAAYVHPLWWCLSLGACLGGNMTIIGAAANVIVAETSTGYGHHISFRRFFKYGASITLISLILSSVYIYFRFLIHI